MSHSIRITVLVENTAEGAGILAEHGLAYWIEWDGHQVLFDTGQGHVLAGNAFRLGISFRAAEAIVLSHGHYDHTGGLAEALKTERGVDVYAHPAALAPKFARKSDGTSRPIGIGRAAERAIRSPCHRLIHTVQPTRIADYVMVTGAVPRVTTFEDTGGPFFLDEACATPDPIEDDQSVFFDTKEGIVVLLGCAHAGIVNTLRYVGALTDDRPIHTVIGGMHLVNASPEKIALTIAELRRIGIRNLAAAHCTGMPATVALWSAFPGCCTTCHAGKTFSFEIP